MMAVPVRRNPERDIGLFDSWEGLPEPTRSDISWEGKLGVKGLALGELEQVRELCFGKLKLDTDKVHLVRGWFHDSIPAVRKKIGNIALLHLDCDWYESVKFCLQELDDDVTEGGYVVIDDYGWWKGCRKAVDEFISQRALRIEFTRVDQTGVYFQKPPG